jgi:outer membrane protein assembly factor BamB
MNNIALFCLLPILWSSPSEKNKIYQWREKDRAGIYQETNLLKSWPAEGPIEIWKVENIGDGFVSPVFDADNMLYYYTLKGDLILLSFDQGKMQEVSSFRIKNGNLQHFSHPVINKGILYQRHGNVLMAFDIRKK